MATEYGEIPGRSAPSGDRATHKANRLIRSFLAPLLLLLPAAALLGWLMVYPAGEAVHLAFTSWDGFSSPKGVGLRNFSELLHDKHFKEALLHNLAFVAAMPVWIGLPYGVAWALH